MNERRSTFALETSYRGRRFRSRAEARWAVFFDALAIEWLYEPEGYATPDGPYLPDFVLPKLKLLVEVKGRDPTAAEKDRCEHVAAHLGLRWIVLAAIERHAEQVEEVHRSGWLGEFEGAWANCDHYYMWCECRFCGAVDVQHEGRSERIACCPQNRDAADYNVTWSPRLAAAYHQALAERFGT